MLSDPLAVTVDGSSRSLPRVGSATPSTPKQVARNIYRTSDGTYSVETRQLEYRDGHRIAEITLRKQVLDSDSGTVYDGYIVSGVGLRFEIGPQGLGASELTNIRDALNSFVTSGLQTRLVGGEV